jgi:hypothetical protein
MLFGVDTSGKIGEGNLYMAVVRHKDSDFMKLLRERVSKRNRAMSLRRRIKASSLKEDELRWVSQNFNSGFSCYALTISDFSEIRKAVLSARDWKFKTLSSLIYITCRNYTKNGDVLLIDRDYSEDVMKTVFGYVKAIFKMHGIDVIVESGDSFNEIIAKADLIAGCCRKNVIKPHEVETKEIIRMIRLLQ